MTADVQLKKVELLSPAKNYEYGKVAIDFGADAVYIGAGRFGARSAAGNSIEEIEKLIRYAHLFNCKVYVTVNTVLFDSELDDVKALINDIYNIGGDAIIIQDLGILEMDLPPIAIHASTQMHNINKEKIRFLQNVGIKRVILPRELSLDEIKDFRTDTSIEFEAFVHGALCVCYSGQCYMSLSLNGRSGNRGECTQPCRSQYNLYNAQNELLIANKHLLSLKDFNAGNYIGEMISAGITSLKIEGRLKDVSYVKNITAYYRQLIDKMENVTKTSSGSTMFSFHPNPGKTFNRGYTNYFVDGKRKKMASFTTQKSIGEKLGTVIQSVNNQVVIDTSAKISNGDGLCFLVKDGLSGFYVNNVEGKKIIANKSVTIPRGTEIYRNFDIAFENTLSNKDAAVRKIDIEMQIQCVDNQFITLTITDEDYNVVSMSVKNDFEVAKNAELANNILEMQLSKVGGSIFRIKELKNLLVTSYFIPISRINEMRRQALELLVEKRLERKMNDELNTFHVNSIPYFEKDIDYSHNVTNKSAENFYRRHGVRNVEYGLDVTKEFDNKYLMTTKYCLRHELGQCLKAGNCKRGFEQELYLENNGRKYALLFDCKRCVMHIKNRDK